MNTPGRDQFIGRILDGRYRVRTRIARGGMGMVYLADDLRLNRQVAVKAMLPHLVDDVNLVRRFEKEAHAAARLNDPNVINVFDQGEADGIPYLVMEYLPSTTLREVLKQQKRLTGAHAIEVSEAVLKGLAAAHRAGYIHRDLKPENIFLAHDGRIKIGDFGLARAAHNNTTTGHALLGTIAYLSPELISGKPADTRSDVYAFGIVLYEMLTGVQPFRGEHPMSIATMHTQEDVPRPSLLSKEATPELDEMVRWTTARDPEKRPKDAAVVLARLYQLLNGGLDAATRVMPSDDTATTARLPHTAVLASVSDAAATQALSTTAAAPQPPLAQYAAPGAAAASGQAKSAQTAAAQNAATQTAATPSARDTAVQQAQQQAVKRRRRGFFTAALVALTATLTAGGGWWFAQGPGSQAVVPELTGQTVQQATLALEQAGLTALPQTTECASVTVPVGAVVQAKPSSHTRVARGAAIELCLSTGPAQLPVPPLVGIPAAEAEQALTAAGFQMGEILSERFHPEVPRGIVLAALDTSHNGLGDFYAEQAPVHFIVSAGPLPQLVELSAADAAGALSEAGLHLDGNLNSEEFHDTIPAGHVIRLQQHGEVLQVGDSVGLVVSKGPELVTVPELRGLRMNEAIAKLEELGLVAETGVPGVLRNAVRVNDTSPAAGEKLPPGTVVKLGFEL